MNNMMLTALILYGNAYLSGFCFRSWALALFFFAKDSCDSVPEQELSWENQALVKYMIFFMVVLLQREERI